MSTDDTPADRRHALLARRDQLYAEQAQRMASRRQTENEARFQRHLGATLTRAGVRYELLWHHDVRRGPLSRYPIGFASVRWDRVPQAVSEQGGSDAAQATLLVAALLALGIAPSATVIVDWCRDDLPRVALSAADASAHALALLRHGSDTWVYADDAPWLIEVYHEGSVTYARGPGRPEDAGDGWRRFV
jgi:hypothetical protein